MPKIRLFLFLCALLLCFYTAGLVLTPSAQASSLRTIKLIVQPTALPHSPVVVEVSALQKRFPDFTPAACVVLTSDAATLAADAKATHFRVLAAQADDLDGDGKADEIAFETDWPASEKRVITLEYGDEADIAPLRPVATSCAHALFSEKYEGLGWENDRVAWRLYLDKRNAIDLYGKTQPRLSLDYFAKPGVNYEKDSPFGRDIWWNGRALGIGSVAAWVDGQAVRVADVAARRPKILANGPVRAIAEMTYPGWKVGGRSVDLTCRLTIWAGQHWFKQDVTAANAGDLLLVTGLPVKPNVSLLTPTLPLTGGQHRYLATWGAQVQQSNHESPEVNGDNLGLAVILSHGPIPPGSGPFPDPLNTLVAISLHSQGNIQTGRFAVVAGWDQESDDGALPEAARSASAWQRYVESLSPAIFTTAAVQIASVAPSPAPAVAAVMQTLDPDPLSRRSIAATMRRAGDYQLAAQVGTRSNGWIRATFYTGLLALYDTTGDRKYLAQATQWADDFNWSPSGREGFSGRQQFHADQQCCIQTYADLARLQKNPAKLARVVAVYEHQMALPRPGREQWSWCDSLFMAPAGMARASAVTGDPRFTAFMESLWWDTAEFLYDKDAHLFFRDKNYFTQKTAGGKKVFWARGNGWVMGGLVRVLEALPAADPNRARFVALHREMAAKIASLQGADGLWRSSLLDPAQFPLPETSGSAFFTYSLAWGIVHHTLDRAAYLPVVQKAWAGLAGKVAADGRLGFVQGVAASPGSVHASDTQEYGVGALLLAGAEMEKLADH